MMSAKEAREKTQECQSSNDMSSYAKAWTAIEKAVEAGTYATTVRLASKTLCDRFIVEATKLGYRAQQKPGFIAVSWR